MIATYIHHLDSVIFKVTDAIQLRWYGFAYLLAFVCGAFLLKHLGNKKLWVFPGAMAVDFIASAAMFGVFLGGRLGYMLFYKPLDWIWTDPLELFRVWEGGMASHGGILGLMIFTFVYCKKYQVSWTGLGDGLCVVAPLGLMFGRIANFINGELWGRVTEVSWAMKFPKTLWDKGMPESANLAKVQNELLQADSTLREAVVQAENGILFLPNEAILERLQESEELRQIVGKHLEQRHPSQLYEAFFEGFLLFIVLYLIRVKFPRLKHGILTGLFFVLYAIGRIFCEAFRQPELGMSNFGMTRGQFLSTFMILIGVAFIIYGAKFGSNAPDDRKEYDKRKPIKKKQSTAKKGNKANEGKV